MEYLRAISTQTYFGEVSNDVARTDYGANEATRPFSDAPYIKDDILREVMEDEADGLFTNLQRSKSTGLVGPKSKSPELRFSPLQLWEGRVQKLNDSAYSFDAFLVDKTGSSEDHVIELSLEWVSEQDKELVKPGAIFYLSLYKTVTPGGTIRNSEEVRFRRLPAWSNKQIAKAYEQGAALFIGAKRKPIAEPLREE